MLPDANFLSPWCQSPSPRVQNRGFCALLGFGTLVFEHFEHKIGFFVRFWGSEPSFSSISSTKSWFLCAFGVWNPCFQAFRAQNRGFCALFGFATLVFRLFEHKIGVFVRFRGLEPLFSRFPSTKSRFLCASYMGCWPGCGNSGLWERNTERWELKSRIGKGRVTLCGDRMCCGSRVAGHMSRMPDSGN